jgi:(1->4)-alpha-D-glucan 1-alpha-D-glucosylmutase
MTLPRATYRLQFRDGMTFDGAAALAPYLARLGVSHLYASPIFTAAPGSTHGYDVADHGEIDPSLGGAAGFGRMVEALKRQGLGLILDIVPNHMAADLANPWWRSVVEWGRQSPHASHFDIDWSQRLTLPLLGRPYDEALDARDIRLALDKERGWAGLALGALVVPLHPTSYESVFAPFRSAVAQAIVAEAGRTAPGEEAAFHKRLKHHFAHAAPLEAEMEDASRDPALIDAVHEGQPWQLIHWKEARRQLSYRRFFEITGLVGVRVEDEAVFDDVHRLTLDLVRSGAVDGLRIDHVDGLADPAGYLTRLRAAIGPRTYLVVEKILEGDETLPDDWPVDGTTGYEFIAGLADLFVDADEAEAMDEAHARCLGERPDPEAMIREARERTLTHNFEGELATLAALATKAAAQAGERIPAETFRDAIAALIVALPVYRTYGARRGMPARDRGIVEQAVHAATQRLGPQARRPLELVERQLLGEVAPGTEQTARIFRARLQQLSGPVMAKAVEDTVFYRFNRLIALNEVGCDPARPAGSVKRFHARMRRMAESGDRSLLATATHDTKRGEDARARLYTLSEAPRRWGEAVERWRGMARSRLRELADGPAPEPATEWLVYQALAGVWPGDDPTTPERLAAIEARFLPYLEKSLREAKLRTSWTAQDAAYEEAVLDHARRLFSPESADFQADFAAVLAPFAAAGRLNGLSQTLIKLTAPGVPDVYQGSEGGDFSLVDPDNRRAPDFDALARRLGAEPSGSAGWSAPEDFAAAKQALVARLLGFRRTHPLLFSDGAYVALPVRGERANHVVAFARLHGATIGITVAPRLMLEAIDEASGSVAEGWWGDTEVELPADRPGRAFAHVLHGEGPVTRLRLRDLPAARPMAFLAG